MKDCASSSYQESTLGELLWPGMLVDRELGNRILAAARICVPDFKRLLDAEQFTGTTGLGAARNPESMCLVLNAIHMQYHDNEQRVDVLDIYTHSSIEPQFMNLAVTHLQGLLLYAFPVALTATTASAIDISTLTPQTVWLRLAEYRRNVGSNPRALRRQYLEHDHTFLLLYMAQKKGCHHMPTGVMLHVEALNRHLGVSGESSVFCSQCYDNILIDQQITDQVDWSHIHTVVCASCGLNLDINKDWRGENTSDKHCNRCGTLLFRYACAKCLVFITEHGWTHCHRCDRCHPLWKECVETDDLCVLCQLPLNNPHYSVVQLRCNPMHVVHGLCLVQNVSKGSYQCPYRCSSIFIPIKRD